MYVHVQSCNGYKICTPDIFVQIYLYVLVYIMRGLIAPFVLQCNTHQKDIKELRRKNELLEHELKQAKEKATTNMKVILI